MNDIVVEHNPSPAKLEVMNVDDWPIWTKEVSTFDWTYDTAETCYILEGSATVTPKKGGPVRLEEGDLVNFARGLSCTWEIHQAIKKHYDLK
ncbi:MAG: cupin domain-containing protein [Gammaproteobacteria bacterium]|nr:cupin domain-containing protein [Gammaproteobacteria bacterium]